MCMGVLPVNMYVHSIPVLYLQRPEEDIRTPGTGVKTVVSQHGCAGN